MVAGLMLESDCGFGAMEVTLSDGRLMNWGRRATYAYAELKTACHRFETQVWQRP